MCRNDLYVILTSPHTKKALEEGKGIVRPPVPFEEASFMPSYIDHPDNLSVSFAVVCRQKKQIRINCGNPWQSQACSQSSIAVSPPSEKWRNDKNY